MCTPRTQREREGSLSYVQWVSDKKTSTYRCMLTYAVVLKCLFWKISRNQVGVVCVGVGGTHTHTHSTMTPRTLTTSTSHTPTVGEKNTRAYMCMHTHMELERSRNGREWRRIFSLKLRERNPATNVPFTLLTERRHSRNL